MVEGVNIMCDRRINMINVGMPYVNMYSNMYLTVNFNYNFSCRNLTEIIDN